MIKVREMMTSKGNVAKSQYELVIGDIRVFQSYSSTIAFKVLKQGKCVYMINERFYKYSNTTTKYTTEFFNYYSSKELHEAVKNKTIEVVIDRDFNGLLEKYTKEEVL